MWIGRHQFCEMPTSAPLAPTGMPHSNADPTHIRHCGLALCCFESIISSREAVGLPTAKFTVMLLANPFRMSMKVPIWPVHRWAWPIDKNVGQLFHLISCNANNMRLNKVGSFINNLPCLITFSRSWVTTGSSVLSMCYMKLYTLFGTKWEGRVTFSPPGSLTFSKWVELATANRGAGGHLSRCVLPAPSTAHPAPRSLLSTVPSLPRAPGFYTFSHFAIPQH